MSVQVLAPSLHTTAAWIIFLLSYAVFAFGRLPGTRLDRTAMAYIGGAAMVVFRVMSARQALASVDFATIILLFAMMLIVAGLHLSGFFHGVVEFLAKRLDARHLLPGVIFASGILSAFLVNDVVCLFMAPLVLRIAHRLRHPVLPLLLGLATASNIGSVATITGNPQNILIGSLSGIGYIEFLRRLGPPALIGLFCDWGLLHLLTRKMAYTEPKSRGDVLRTEQETPAHLRWALFVVFVVLVGFFAGIAPPLTAAIGGALMLLHPSINRHQLFEEVDWSLLVLFTGLFIVVGGAEVSGIASRLLSLAMHGNLHQPLVFATAVTFLSNIVSNVPAVMLLKGVIPQFPNPHDTWLLLAMTSTLAGNLTITGSVANIIVVEKARHEAPISFMQYLRVGVPVTLVTMAAGMLWIRFL